jgi:N-acetylglucosaminyldiphosphoundecaprenol N-acetyl-beta-D-mannosaminyltransferase
MRNRSCSSAQGSMRVLGVPVSLVNMQSAVQRILSWGRVGSATRVFFRDVHGLMRTLEDPALLELHENADLVLPDGMPLVWVARLRGHGDAIGRTPGADLMEEVCRQSVSERLTHYFFGGKPGVAERMAESLSKRFPGLRIVGIYSPPMRDVDAVRPFEERELEEIDLIRCAEPDFIWVGLSSPKQEYWIAKAAALLPHGVFLGVGAAFDFHSGAVARAPTFMQNTGLEWLHRLLSEPSRLWRRYLILAPRFVGMVLAEEFVAACQRLWRTIIGHARAQNRFP